MNDIQQPPAQDAAPSCAKSRATASPRAELDRATGEAAAAARTPALGAARCCCCARHWAIGFWQHYRLHAQVMATAEQRRDFRPERADGAGARERQHDVGELGRARPKHSSRPISTPGRAAISPGARSISAAASKPGNCSSRSRRPSSSIRSRRPRGRSPRCRPRCNRRRPIAISPRSPGIATSSSCKKVGSPRNKATPIA